MYHLPATLGKAVRFELIKEEDAINFCCSADQGFSPLKDQAFT
jgi:hypothetical protein